MESLMLELTKENVYTNWMRNGLITTLVALTLYGFAALLQDLGEAKYLRLIRWLSIFVLGIAIYIFWRSNSFSSGRLVSYFLIAALLMIATILFFIS